MEKIERLGEKAWTVTSIIGGVFIVIYLLLTIANIIMRRFFNNPIFGVTELICYASLTACCFALAQTEWKGGNVTVTLIQEKCSDLGAKIINMINCAVSFVGFFYVSYHCVRQVFVKYATGGTTTDTHIPFYILTIILAAGFILLDICVLMKLIIAIIKVIDAKKNAKAMADNKENFL